MKDDEDQVLNEDEQFERDKKDGFYNADEDAESEVQTTRKGLAAYAALTTLIGAILLFMGIGWSVDKYFGTSPWGITLGIVIGSVIGFYQFIRISSKNN